MGIICVFMYMITFFLAFFSLDQRRIEDRRDGLICCWKRGDDWTPNKCSEVSCLSTMVGFDSESH